MPDPITQYLLSRGATPSGENASRVRAAYASNPDLLDRRAMGLPGGLDDNSASIDAALDAVLAKSMPPAASIPQGSVDVGTPEKAPPPSRTAPTVKGPGEVGGTKAVATGSPSRQDAYGPGSSPSRQGEYDTPTAHAAAPTGVTGDLTGASYASGSQVGPTQRSGVTEWLLGLLGAGAGAYGLSKMGGGGTPVPTNAPLPGTVPPGTAPVDATDPAVMKARMQAEIDAENDAMARQMEQEALRRKKQIETQEIARAARRATGRR